MILAPGRADRPHEFRRVAPREAKRCAFCRQKALRAPRVASLSGFHSPRARLVAGFPGELIVESQSHGDFGRLSDAQAHRAVRLWESRLRRMSTRPGVRFALLFKERGHAGAARHARTEIVGLPLLPERFRHESGRAVRFFRRTGRCLLCGVIREELRVRVRVIEENASFLAFCPYASHSPYEMTIVPKAHRPQFLPPDVRTPSFARILRNVLRKAETALADRPYSLVLHAAPAGVGPLVEGAFHWRVEITPRVSHLAGFEWGGGIHINPVSPEKAASELRRTGHAS